MRPFANPMMVGGGLGLDTDAKALIGRMTVKPDKTRQTLISDTIKSLKTSGIWAKLDILFMFAAHTEQASLLNWKGNAAWDATITGSGSSKAATLVLDRGLDASSGTDATSGGAIRSAYQETAGQMTQNSGCIFSQTLGARTSHILFTGRKTRIAAKENLIASEGAILSAAGFSGSGNAPSTTDSERFIILNRSSSASFVLGHDANAEVTITSASAAPAAGTLHISATNSATPTGVSTDFVRVVGAGAGLTTANRSSLRNAIWAYLDAIGCPR